MQGRKNHEKTGPLHISNSNFVDILKRINFSFPIVNGNKDAYD